jgi:hypothetical protein
MLTVSAGRKVRKDGGPASAVQVRAILIFSGSGELSKKRPARYMVAKIMVALRQVVIANGTNRAILARRMSTRALVRYHILPVELLQRSRATRLFEDMEPIMHTSWWGAPTEKGHVGERIPGRRGPADSIRG